MIFTKLPKAHLNRGYMLRKSSTPLLFVGFLASGVILNSAANAITKRLQLASPQHATDHGKQIASAFLPFAPSVKTHSDRKNFFVESNGMPNHRLMVGITNWQQQVPMPQNYTGDNAWQFPLAPVPAANPLSGKDHFFRGAMAIAVDGVPIFNALNNRGEDSFKIGELDEFGGHSGRGDDYHYHIAPTYLQKFVGPNKPIAYALDGYPIYGAADPDGTAPKDLDAFNGHTTVALGYHYHATKTYPYLNGGFHGEVFEREGQVDPQPRANTVRLATRPLPGARITGFEQLAQGSYSLTYTLDGATCKVNYSVQSDGSWKFDYVDADGKTTARTYRSRPGGGGGKGRGDEEPRPPRPDSHD